MCNCKTCTILKFLFLHLVWVFNALCVPLFIRTTCIAVVLAPFWPKGSLLTENVYQLHSPSPMVKNPSKSVICSACSRVCSYLHSFFTLSHPLESPCGIERFCIFCSLVVMSCFSLGVLIVVLQGCSSRLSNVGFISKGRLFWIWWLGRICFWILST